MKRLNYLFTISCLIILHSCNLQNPANPAGTCDDPGAANTGELRWCDIKVPTDTTWGKPNDPANVFMIRAEGEGSMGRYLYSVFLPGKDAPTTTQTYEIVQQTINIPAGKAYVGATVPISQGSQDVFRCRTGQGTVEVKVNNGKYEVVFTNVLLENNYNNAETKKASMNITF